MYISLRESRAKGFRRWSEIHQAHSNDDADDIARVDTLAVAAWGGEYAVKIWGRRRGGAARLPPQWL
jgi:hypothetical protein